MIENVITSLIAFVSTNIDDLFILMLFFASNKYRSSHIIGGQYLGIAVLVTIGLIGSFIGQFVDTRYIGLLGLFPIYLGMKQVYRLVRKEPDEDYVATSNRKSDVIAIATVTIANGGDNIGIYVPLLATWSNVEKTGFVVVFTILVFAWCMLAKYLANHPIMAGTLRKYSHIIMPIVLILLGVFILIESNTLSMFEIIKFTP